MIIINLLIMDQHIAFTNLTPASFNIHTLESISNQFPPPNFDFYANNPNKLMSHQQLIGALIQICNMLDQQLRLQLRRNQILLENMYSGQFVDQVENVEIKEEFVEQNRVKLQEKEQQKLDRVDKQKKLAVNDTKNISKNFGKAVITFIQKSPEKVRRILQNHNIDLTLFSNQLKQRKKNLISIKQLRSLWLQSQFEYAKPFREISYLFLRKASFKYIFGSRIADYAGHLKYRKRMIQALHSPKEFTSIKQ